MIREATRANWEKTTKKRKKGKRRDIRGKEDLGKNLCSYDVRRVTTSTSFSDFVTFWVGGLLKLTLWILIWDLRVGGLFEALLWINLFHFGVAGFWNLFWRSAGYLYLELGLVLVVVYAEVQETGAVIIIIITAGAAGEGVVAGAPLNWKRWCSVWGEI